MPNAAALLAQLLPRMSRARQRRLLMTAGDRFDLQALAAVDNSLDRDLRAVTVLGQAGLDAAALALQAAASQPERDALLHVYAALLVQSPGSAERDAAFLGLAAESIDKHRTALRDAVWFFPMGGMFAKPRQDSIEVLLNSDSTALQDLAIELIGRTGNVGLARQLAAGGELASTGTLHSRELALARCGLLATLPPERVTELLRGNEVQQTHVLRMASIAGRPMGLTADVVEPLVDASSQPLKRLAWAMLVMLKPRRAFEVAANSTTLDPDLGLRIFALCGFADGLIPAVAAMLGDADPASPATRDLLLCMLGTLPMEVRTRPIDATARERAMRELVLNALRQSHLGVTNQADSGPWQTNVVIAPDAPVTSVRIRGAVRMRGLPESLPAHTVNMTATMRQALYIELAHAQSAAIGLSAYDVARRQMLALGLSSGFAEALADEAAV